MTPTLVTIAALHWLALVTPGMNVLLVSQLAASGYRRSACYAGFGVTVVAGAWAMLAIVGVNALFAALPALRVALQIAGGVYLVYIACRLWRSGAPTSPEGKSLSPSSAFRLGFLTNIMNPKSALFFGSIFAAALPPEPGMAMSAAAVALVFANALLWHTFLAIAFSHARIQAAYECRRRTLSRAAGALVGAFGLHLLAAIASEIRATRDA